MSNVDKIERLNTFFKEKDRVLVAFSGGVDSTFLLYSLARIKGIIVRGITIKTPYIPQWEVDEAIAFCSKHGIEHDTVIMPFPDSILKNPDDRCYRCKKILFARISEYAKQHKFNYIADGSNADDAGEYRPGMKALKELNTISPLLGAGITKNEIRKMLKEYGLPIWNKPAYACLLTRIPHNINVDEKMLFTIEQAEVFIKNLGFPGTRVRLHGDLARLECKLQHLNDICSENIRDKITDHLKELGIKYITIDLEGYRTGSLDSNPDKHL